MSPLTGMCHNLESAKLSSPPKAASDKDAAQAQAQQQQPAKAAAQAAPAAGVGRKARQALFTAATGVQKDNAAAGASAAGAAAGKGAPTAAAGTAGPAASPSAGGKKTKQALTLAGRLLDWLQGALRQLLKECPFHMPGELETSRMPCPVLGQPVVLCIRESQRFLKWEAVELNSTAACCMPCAAPQAPRCSPTRMRMPWRRPAWPPPPAQPCTTRSSTPAITWAPIPLTSEPQQLGHGVLLAAEAWPDACPPCQCPTSIILHTLLHAACCCNHAVAFSDLDPCWACACRATALSTDVEVAYQRLMGQDSVLVTQWFNDFCEVMMMDDGQLAQGDLSSEEESEEGSSSDEDSEEEAAPARRRGRGAAKALAAAAAKGKAAKVGAGMQGRNMPLDQEPSACIRHQHHSLSYPSCMND